MNKINLKEILDGELIDEPGNLSQAEKYEFAMALTAALAARRNEFDGSDEDWDSIADNYLSYLIDNFPIDIIMAASVIAFRIYNIDFNAETDTFYRFYEEITPWILSDSEDFKVYVGDGKHVDHETWEKNKTPSKENYGGNFTLRDHNK